MPDIDIASLFVYRIVHINNLDHILKNGMFTRDHEMFDPDYVNIGKSEIIDVREAFPVKIQDYGFIGDYVPFYFGRRSIMLYNILTGYGGLQKHNPDDIIYLCCKLTSLIEMCPKFFFTDGQANKQFTGHFKEIKDLNNIDWAIVTGNDFRKTAEEPDKPRKYQAEFLVHQYVPVSCIDKIVIHSKSVVNRIETLLSSNGLKIPVKIAKKDFYYFYF